jgi:hypothetical protein
MQRVQVIDIKVSNLKDKLEETAQKIPQKNGSTERITELSTKRGAHYVPSDDEATCNSDYSVPKRQNSTPHNLKNEKEIHGNDVWIVGSSILRDLKPKLIYKYRNTRVTTLRDKTIYGAKKFIEEENVKVKVVTFQIGSNDLENKNADEAIEDFKTLILKTQQLLPESEIVVSEILPRFYESTPQSRSYELRKSLIRCYRSCAQRRGWDT